jgi:DNA mismatch repair protein MutS
VAAALAELAVQNRYTRPVVDAGLAFDIRGGRHPVVEAALKKQNADFIANDCALDGKGRLWLLTGPNMAGKSTFLRQNALITLMAQTGCYVPAAQAHIGAVDRLFSRVGAADDLARGRSTFMVEMVETATILNQATARSLVILDEIGRGTSTFDGLSIAWACLEYLHEQNKCRALFATHYHELTSLAEKLAHLACHTMRVKEWKDTVVFLHEVATGTADRSYGIHVAKLAGLPPAVIGRAEEVLKTLETGKTAKKISADLPLFSVAPKEPPKPSAVETALKDIDPDSLSPREALEALYALKKLS